MDGVATSGEDAMKVPLGDGSDFYPPVYIQRYPEEGFEAAPDTRMGMMEEGS